MKKAFFLFVLFIIFGLVACSTDNTSNEETGTENTTDTGLESNSTESGNGEGITLRVMDWFDSEAEIREEFHEKFVEEHPEVSEIEYTMLTVDQFRDTILTAVRTGEAPDIFPYPTGFEVPTLVEEGWYLPINEYVSEVFLSKLPAEYLVEGINMVDGDLYAIPQNKALPQTFVFYNKDLFEAVGLDPNTPPSSYQEFREYAKQITEAGNGEFYGFIEGGSQINRWNELVLQWSALAGSGLSSATPVSLLNGEAPYHTEAVTDIFDLFAGMADDGSIHPQTSGISAPEARQLFANGEAAFLSQGSWTIGGWKSSNPELNFGVMAPPVSEEDRDGAVNLTIGAGPGIYAESEHPELAAMYLEELYAGDYFQSEVIKNDVNVSLMSEVNDEYLTGESLDYNNIAQEVSVLAPSPATNPDVLEVFSEYKDVSPTAGDILQGVAVAGMRDYEPMLKELSEKTDAALAQAIEAANNNGVDVSIDDSIFSEWDPKENYTN